MTDDERSLFVAPLDEPEVEKMRGWPLALTWAGVMLFGLLVWMGLWMLWEALYD